MGSLGATAAHAADAIRMSHVRLAPQPEDLHAVRIAAGAMLFYTHLVWSLALDDFFGPTSWINAIAARDGIGRADV